VTCQVFVRLELGSLDRDILLALFYLLRPLIVEPVFGWAKQALDFRQFSVRGRDAVTGEWNLVCLALNLRRMQRLGWAPA
jgi:hypothetical protein